MGPCIAVSAATAIPFMGLFTGRLVTEAAEVNWLDFVYLVYVFCMVNVVNLCPLGVTIRSHFFPYEVDYQVHCLKLYPSEESAFLDLFEVHRSGELCCSSIPFQLASTHYAHTNLAFFLSITTIRES